MPGSGSGKSARAPAKKRGGQNPRTPSTGDVMYSDDEDFRQHDRRRGRAAADEDEDDVDVDDDGDGDGDEIEDDDDDDDDDDDEEEEEEEEEEEGESTPGFWRTGRPRSTPRSKCERGIAETNPGRPVVFFDRIEFVLDRDRSVIATVEPDSDIYVNNYEPHEAPWIAHVKAIFAPATAVAATAAASRHAAGPPPAPEGTQVAVQWYIRPSELPKHRNNSHSFGKDELLVSNHYRNQLEQLPLECIDGLCRVLSFPAYCRHRAQLKRDKLLGRPPPNIDVYFVRSEISLGQSSARPSASTAAADAASSSATTTAAAAAATTTVMPRPGASSASHRAASRSAVPLKQPLASRKTAAAADISPPSKRARTASPAPAIVDPISSALFDACSKGDYAAVCDLLRRGASVNFTNKEGYTPLHEACLCGHAHVVRELLAHNADVHAKGPDETTPLHDAAEFNERQIIRMLLDHGASPKARTKDGFRPIDLTEEPATRAIFRNLERK